MNSMSQIHLMSAEHIAAENKRMAKQFIVRYALGTAAAIALLIAVERIANKMDENEN